MLTLPISNCRINELRFAYGILHELCEDINRIYGFTSLLFLCFSNVAIQYHAFQYLKIILSIVYDMNKYFIDLTLVLKTLSTSSAVLLLFWTCYHLESEVSNLYI
jgi:hypothetical protein